MQNPARTFLGVVSAKHTCACLPWTEKKGASNRWYSTSFPKRPGVPCRPTGQRRSFSVTMSVPFTRLSQNPVGLSDSGNLLAGGSSTRHQKLRAELCSCHRPHHYCSVRLSCGPCLHEKPMMSTEAGTAEVLKCPYSPMVLPALQRTCNTEDQPVD